MGEEKRCLWKYCRGGGMLLAGVGKGRADERGTSEITVVDGSGNIIVMCVTKE